ncbi:MAG: hypothetical protein DI626_01980 [Micavibrio aeruginosavorus]|uniref:Uncharacterized protein n=1 Tax=Micavibrio aeruginosavorus TaxID=349221 RepID=A0A2W5C2S4_9BACT|nr:MAG: hypothetical protein DI626_01980 [Micavibrio aeruginosavorus]
MEKPAPVTGVRRIVSQVLEDANETGSLVTVFVRNAQNPDDAFLVNRIKGVGGCKVESVEQGAFRVETQKWRVELMERAWPMLEISPKPFQ